MRAFDLQYDFNDYELIWRIWLFCEPLRIVEIIEINAI